MYYVVVRLWHFNVGICYYQDSQMWLKHLFWFAGLLSPFSFTMLCSKGEFYSQIRLNQLFVFVTCMLKCPMENMLYWPFYIAQMWMWTGKCILVFYKNIHISLRWIYYYMSHNVQHLIATELLWYVAKTLFLVVMPHFLGVPWPIFPCYDSWPNQNNG